ncbi:MAG: hypothetical protein V4722_17660 [Bacteroidota bacterium]
MTPRSLFNIILKVLGIFFIKDVVTTVPQLISTAVYLLEFGTGNGSLRSLIYAVLQLAIFTYVSYFLIFNTHKLIDLFKLDKGFEEDQFTFQIDASSVYRIAIIVTGAFILVNEIPEFCRFLFNSFEEGSRDYIREKTGISRVVVSVVKMLIGLLLIGERNRIADFFERKQTNSKEDEIE